VLAQHHPSGSLPIPIEHILEFGYGVSIIPIPELQAVHEIEAFTSKNLKSVMVDESVMTAKSPFRYRFSLAHELGHIVLHAKDMEAITFATANEWKRAIQEMPEEDRQAFEWQAYTFAGLILVPHDPLRDALQKAIAMAESQGVSIRLQVERAKAYVCTWIGRIFEVSAPVIEKRMIADVLWPPK
jgi:hypothetical protein